MSSRFGRIVLGLLIVGAILATLAGGWGGLGVYAFLVLLVAALAWGLRVGGGWMEDASRGRFDRDGRR